MSSRNVFAYTQVTERSYPGYVSLNETEGDKHVFLTVRTPGSMGTQVASVPVPDDQLEALAQSILKHLDAKRGTGS